MEQPVPDTGEREQEWRAVPAGRRLDAPEPEPEPEPAEYGPEDFPGCESFHLPASELDDYEGRLEFWDGVTETAWRVSEGASIEHEAPSRDLTQIAGQLAMLRGSRIKCLGSANLVRLDAAGRKRWLMQADEMLYLHPDRVRLQGPAVNVDTDPLPDVVLEVDHTTDVRRRKLEIYKQSGFPEIWVLVPWNSSRRAPGLVIHVRRGDAYREEAESARIAGWKAEEIHRALTEDPMSGEARRALVRVALAMGRREGTEPEHHPLTRSLSSRARAKGRAEGRVKGHAEGRVEGHAEGRVEGHLEGVHAVVLQVLGSRGISVSASLVERSSEVGHVPHDVLVNAALTCRDEADFLRRIRAAPR